MRAQISFILLSLSAVLLFTENVRCEKFPDWSEMLKLNSCAVVTESMKEEAISQFTTRFYYGKDEKHVIVVPLNNSISLLKEPKFNISAPIMVYMTGWTQNVDDTLTNQTIQAFLGSCNCNLLLVNWTSVSKKSQYTESVALVPASGKAIAEALDEMIDGGAKLGIISGLSLGGQVIGHIGRNMRNKPNHIVAADPAGPNFYPPLKCEDHITADDADCVEIIHTDAGLYGAPETTGDFDYWVNGGRSVQPGCLNPINQQLSSICSHARSLYLYQQVFKRSPTLFASRKCDNWLDFQSGKCKGNAIAYIGTCSDKRQAGDYYLRTTGVTPWGRGKKGADPPSKFCVLFGWFLSNFFNVC